MLFALFVKCFFYVLFGGVFLGAGTKGYGVFWHIAGSRFTYRMRAAASSVSGLTRYLACLAALFSSP